MSCPRFVAIALGVYVQGCLNARMPQYALHRFRLDFRLIHQPVTEAMAHVMQTKSAAVWDLNACLDCCRPKMVSNKNRRREWDTPFGLERRKYKVCLVGLGGHCSPLAQVPGQGRMKWNVPL